MSAFQDNSITDAGRALLADVQLGMGTFVPTKIEIGDGYIPSGQTVRTMTALSSPVATLLINKSKKTASDTAIFGGKFSNSETTTPFYFRELGLFAKIKYDSGEYSEEVLYSYGNAYDNAELIPAYTAGSAIERQLDLLVYVGNDTNVSIQIDTGTYVTLEQHNIDLSKKADLVDGVVPREQLPSMGGIPPQLIITTVIGATITATSGGYTIVQTAETSTLVLDLQYYGLWTVSTTLSGVPITTTVLVDDVKQYKVNLTGTVATVQVIACTGSTVLGTGISLNLSGTGTTTFDIFQTGLWTFSASLGGTTVEKTLVVEQDKSYTIDLRILTQLNISTLPDNQDYLTLEEFDTTGLSILAVYKDGELEDVTDTCNYFPKTMTYGLEQVDATYSLAGISKTVSIPVTVEKRIPTFSLNKSTLNLTETIQTGTITISTDSTGSIVLGPVNTSVIEAEVVEKTILVTLVNPGYTPISVYTAENDVYKQSETKICTVNVAKFTGTIELSKTSIALTEDDMSDSFTVTTSNTGNIVATSNNTNVATVLASGKTITVTGKKPGNCVISVYAQSDSIYNQTQTKTCNVTLDKFTGTISINPTSVTLSPANNLTAQVQVTTTNSAIYASTSSGWYTESVSGKTVTLTANKQGVGGANALSIYGVADSVYNQTIKLSCSVNVSAPKLNVTAKAGATVFVEKDTETLQATANSSGIASFTIWEYGTWSVYGTSNGVLSDVVTVNINTTGTYTAELNFYRTYGVKIYKHNSNPETAVTYIDDAVGMIPKSSTWDDTPIFKGIRPCVLKNGVVQYYLNPDNMTKKVDGSEAIIDSIEEGDVMIEIPKLGYQITNDGDYVYVRVTEEPNKEGFCYLAHSKDTVGDCDYIYIGRYQGYVENDILYSVSGKKPTVLIGLTRARQAANSKGNGYELFSFYPFTLLQCLYLIRYKNRDSQTALGNGLTGQIAEGQPSGMTNGKGMYYGAVSDTIAIVFAGIENLYGNLIQRLDGVCVDENLKILTAYKNYNNTGAGYPYSQDSGIPEEEYALRGYYSGGILDVQGTNNGGFFIKLNGGSNSTYYTDNSVIKKLGCAGIGGPPISRLNGGMFYMDCQSQADSGNGATGVRLAYKHKR